MANYSREQVAKTRQNPQIGSRGRAEIFPRLGRSAEQDAHHLGNTRILHGHAVEFVIELHGAFIVGDDDELRAFRHLS